MPQSFGTSSEFPTESVRPKKARRSRSYRAKAAEEGTEGQEPLEEQEPQEPKTPAFEYVVKLCMVRERSSAELEKRLVEKGYNKESAQEAVQRAVECGVVDDMRFADAFIRGRVSAGKGIELVKRDLAKHGIDLEQVEGWEDLYHLDDESQLESALDFLEKHPPKAKDAWGAAYRKLTVKGYSSSVSSRAARRWSESK